MSAVHSVVTAVPFAEDAFLVVGLAGGACARAGHRTGCRAPPALRPFVRG